MRDEIIAKIREKKLIAIVRGIESSKCVKVAEALYEGGFQFVEVTFNLSKPETFSQTAEAIKAIDEQLAGKVIDVYKRQEPRSSSNCGHTSALNLSCMAVNSSSVGT